MRNKPRDNHFIAQSWIKRFPDTDGKIWTFDKVSYDQIKPRPPKKIMQLFNLYTVQPSGIDDTTLEEVDLMKLDNDGKLLFDRVLAGDRSQASKEELADFLAVQIMRDPKTITSYNRKAQDLVVELLTAFDAPDYQSFSRVLVERIPGTLITEHEYNHIKSVGLKVAESTFEQLITELDTTEGLPDLPFTDLVRVRDGRNIVRDRLLTLEWTLKTSPSGGFVLGDAGVLFDKSELTSLRAPLSNAAALDLVFSDHPAQGILAADAAPHDVDNLNLESAARARRWLVGSKSRLEMVKHQVGKDTPF